MKKVLIADDASFMRQMIRDIIEPEGWEVVGEASDGVDVVDKFKKLRPDVVMMDIVMPKRSGIDAVKAIKAEDPGARVVMCSALGQEALVTEAIQAGAKDFIVKPFKPDAVLATLAKVAEKAELSVDLAKYRALFLEEATEHLAEMSRACLALEKEPANGEAIDLVFRMAHSIKGMAASLDYDAVTAARAPARGPHGGVADAGPRGRARRVCGSCSAALEGLERTIGVVQATGESPAAGRRAARASSAKKA